MGSEGESAASEGKVGQTPGSPYLGWEQGKGPLSPVPFSPPPGRKHTFSLAPWLRAPSPVLLELWFPRHPFRVWLLWLHLDAG